MSESAEGTGWVSPSRKRKELTAVGLFVLVSLLVPLLKADLCPFSRAPMFADAPTCYCVYRVLGPDGTQLDELAFGLQRNYWGNPPGEGVGYAPPASVDVFGRVASREEVEAVVVRHLADLPRYPRVDVIQEVVGPVGLSVGPIAEHRWTFWNPHGTAR